MQIYCAINALLYVALGAWCALMPEQTASQIGFALTSEAARSEYFTVYGGMELGFGVFFALGALRLELRRGAVTFGACLYVGLALFRALSLTFVAPVTFVLTLGSIEVVMAVWALALLSRSDSACGTMQP